MPVVNRSSSLYLGIEIGGTKLQLGVGRTGGFPLETLRCFEINQRLGAAGILRQIESCALKLKEAFPLRRIGIGFGGPVNFRSGCVIRSHHIEGWHDFPLAQWCQQTLNLPTVVDNDCDAAGLAEATIGAGRDSRVVFYVTVGSGVGGGLIIDRQIYHGTGTASAEIGHLRPGLKAVRPEEAVESVASGWSIEAAVRSRLGQILESPRSSPGANKSEYCGDAVASPICQAERTCQRLAMDLLQRAEGRVERVTSRIIGQAAAQGNQIAIDILERACESLGWAIAQVVTLVAPDVVIIGGGVSQLGEELFIAPIRRAVEGYVFPPLLRSYKVLSAALGAEVVVHGAIALASTAEQL